MHKKTPAKRALLTWLHKLQGKRHYVLLSCCLHPGSSVHSTGALNCSFDLMCNEDPVTSLILGFFSISILYFATLVVFLYNYRGICSRMILWLIWVIGVWSDASFSCLIGDKAEVVFQCGTLGYYFITIHCKIILYSMQKAVERFNPLQITCKLHREKWIFCRQNKEKHRNDD